MRQFNLRYRTDGRVAQLLVLLCLFIAAMMIVSLAAHQSS